MRFQAGRPNEGRASPGGGPARASGCRLGLAKVLPPELCVAAAVVLVVAVGITISSEAGPEGDPTGRGRLGTHNAPVEGLSLSPDGRTAASASRDGTVKVWGVAVRRWERVALRATAGFTSVAFAPDGRTLVAGGLRGEVCLCNLETGEAVTVRAGRGRAVRGVAFAPGGEAVASGGDDRTVWIDSLRPGPGARRVLRGHAGFVQQVAYAPDGRTLASVSLDGEAILWDLGSGRIRARFRCGSPLSSLAFAPDGRMLAVGGVGRIALLEIATGRLRSLACAQSRVTSLHYLPQGGGLLSSGLDGSIVVWTLADDGLPQAANVTLRGHTGGVKSLAVSPDGTMFLSGGNDDAVKFWELGNAGPGHFVPPSA